MFSKSQIQSPTGPSVKNLQDSIAGLPRLSSEDEQEMYDMLHMLGRLQRALESKIEKSQQSVEATELKNGQQFVEVAKLEKSSQLVVEETTLEKTQPVAETEVIARSIEALVNPVEYKVDEGQQRQSEKALPIAYLNYPQCPSCDSFAIKKVRRSLLQKLSHPQEGLYYCSSCKENFLLPL